MLETTAVETNEFAKDLAKDMIRTAAVSVGAQIIAATIIVGVPALLSKHHARKLEKKLQKTEK